MSVHHEVYRGYDIRIDTEAAPESPRDWHGDAVVFVSFDPRLSHIVGRSSRDNTHHRRHREDLLAFMARNKEDSSSAQRVFAVSINLTDNGVYAPGCTFDGEVFSEDFACDEDDDNFDRQAWESELPQAAIIVKRGHFDQALTTEMLVRVMETGEEPDFDADGAELAFHSWLAWFGGEVYEYIISTDHELLLERGVAPDQLRDFELIDACCGYYALSPSYLKRRKWDTATTPTDAYGGALIAARDLVDGHLEHLALSNTLPPAFQETP